MASKEESRLVKKFFRVDRQELSGTWTQLAVVCMPSEEAVWAQARVALGPRNVDAKLRVEEISREEYHSLRNNLDNGTTKPLYTCPVCGGPAGFWAKKLVAQCLRCQHSFPIERFKSC